MSYLKDIAEILDRLGLHFDPRHVKAWMVDEHKTLDHLTPAQFEKEVKIAVHCCIAAGEEDSRRLAQSYGLIPCEAVDAS